jgi:hypothetical protein
MLVTLYAMLPLAAAQSILTFYMPDTDISTTSQLDVSQAALESALGESPINWAGALTAYTSTANGDTSLQALSTGAQAAMGGQTLFDMYKAYFSNNADYASDRVTGALSDPVTGICASVCQTSGTPCDQCRKEISKKSSNYMGVWMWIIGKMETAVAACGGTPLPDWDDALAYYSGSREGADGSGSGKFIYHLADKRAENYDTRFSNGTSNVNVEIIQQFRNGKDSLASGDCAGATAAKSRIVTLMSIPLVQGSLRYAYKVGVLAGGSKERAEGDVFSAAILPRIHNCNANAAAQIVTNMDYNAATPMVDGFASVKAAFESVYDCLGISCGEIGCLIETGNTCYADFQECAPSVLTFYAPATDISFTSRLDVSQAALESALGETPINWAGALTAYTRPANGGTSLQALSTGAQAAMGGQTIFDMYKAYFSNHADYTSDRVTGALSDPVTGICATVCQTSGTACDQCRKEISKKSSNYMGVWMWIIGKMETAVAACSGTPLPDWDAALAYYSGSLEGADGLGSGKFIYHLADKRAENYGTRHSNGTSNVNVEIIQQFRNGKDALTSGNCAGATAAKDRIVTLMSIPLVQGALRYAYKVGELSGGSKERAEGDVFSAAILPRINTCSATAATQIALNLDYNAATPMVDGFAAVKAAFELVYDCLGISCHDIGCLIETGNTCYIGFQECGGSIDAAFHGRPSAWVAMSVTAVLVLFLGK